VGGRGLQQQQQQGRSAGSLGIWELSGDSFSIKEMHLAYPSVYSKVNCPHSISQRGMPGILPVDCGAAFSDMKILLKK